MEDITKRELRSALQAQASLPEDVHERDSAMVCERVLAHACWSSAGSIAAFVGVHHEPSTTLLLEAALNQRRSLWLPKVDVGRILWCRLDANTPLDEQLVRGAFGLLEPAPALYGQVRLPEVELVLVPGLAFDALGARLGWGKGYYDRALASTRGNKRPWRVGICFDARFEPAQGAIPVDAHDVPMHAVATPRRWIDCSTKIRTTMR